ncbi:hypothetical protein VNO77_03671 [Canavalia gladiata]|uniref:Uncharacterized protein n=1 Tax=Canavalia gladiata TaxID=3824 RepID=A0AAN9MX57_CANGL
MDGNFEFWGIFGLNGKIRGELVIWNSGGIFGISGKFRGRLVKHHQPLFLDIGLFPQLRAHTTEMAFPASTQNSILDHWLRCVKGLVRIHVATGRGRTRIIDFNLTPTVARIAAILLSTFAWFILELNIFDTLARTNLDCPDVPDRFYILVSSWVQRHMLCMHDRSSRVLVLIVMCILNGMCAGRFFMSPIMKLRFYTLDNDGLLSYLLCGDQPTKLSITTSLCAIHLPITIFLAFGIPVMLLLQQQDPSTLHSVKQTTWTYHGRRGYMTRLLQTLSVQGSCVLIPSLLLDSLADIGGMMRSTPHALEREQSILPVSAIVLRISIQMSHADKNDAHVRLERRRKDEKKKEKNTKKNGRMRMHLSHCLNKMRGALFNVFLFHHTNKIPYRLRVAAFISSQVQLPGFNKDYTTLKNYREFIAYAPLALLILANLDLEKFLR